MASCVLAVALQDRELVFGLPQETVLWKEDPVLLALLINLHKP